MANQPINMLKIRRILQLLQTGASKSSISRHLIIHRKTLDGYLRKIESSGQDYNWLLAQSDKALGQIVYGKSIQKQPDPLRYDNIEDQFAYFTRELKSPGVTRMTLWEEYKEAYPEGYSYSQFCFHYAKYNEISKATMRLNHIPGDVMQIDFAGKTLSIVDRKTGEVADCPVLVCVLPYSGKTYVEVLPRATKEYLFSALNRCVEYFGGVPNNVLSDNMRQIVTSNNRYEYSFTEIAEQWSVHYNTNLIAARPRKPKDKPTVENAVWLSYLRIYAKLRHEEFYSIVTLNERILDLLERHNTKQFQGKGISRQDKFEAHEKAELKALPSTSYQIKYRTHGLVNKDYHVQIFENKHFYSVPYKYIGKETNIIYDNNTVEVFIGLDRIAIHSRSFVQYDHTTVAEHMPANHLRYKETLGWNAEYFMDIAKNIGPYSEIYFTKMLASKELIQQTYQACIGLKRLSESYGKDRFENACKRAEAINRVSYGLINRMLKNNLDKVEIQPTLFETPIHENIRGANEFN